MVATPLPHIEIVDRSEDDALMHEAHGAEATLIRTMLKDVPEERVVLATLVLGAPVTPRTRAMIEWLLRHDAFVNMADRQQLEFHCSGSNIIAKPIPFLKVA